MLIPLEKKDTKTDSQIILIKNYVIVECKINGEQNTFIKVFRNRLKKILLFKRNFIAKWNIGLHGFKIKTMNTIALFSLYCM